jgi:hypothetical protein
LLHVSSLDLHLLQPVSHTAAVAVQLFAMGLAVAAPPFSYSRFY